jgi:hypothetical protein
MASEMRPRARSVADTIEHAAKTLDDVNDNLARLQGSSQ